MELPLEVTHSRTLQVEVRTRIKVRRCKLAVQTGSQAAGKAVGGPPKQLVSEKERIRLGTHPSNDLVIDDRTASRQHCEIQYTDRGYLLVDLDSTNGTYVDGQRAERVFLTPGATITIGTTAVVFTPMDEDIDVELDGDGFLGGMVGKSLRMRQLFGLIKKIAPMDVSVVIQGETGTGKELAARAVHDLSPRAKGPFVVLDCGAIPPNLIESELFGHEKGSFTGATSSRPGAFERANGGTIFLDELGELQLDLQPKLLRVLENRELRRVGGNETIGVDVRVLAATNRDLTKEVQAGRFREDLYFRLSVINLQLPPLRLRRDDIAPIIKHVLDDPETLARHGPKRLTPRAMAILMAYAWPGNVRELINVVSHVLTFSEGPEIDVAVLPPRLQGDPSQTPMPFNEHLAFKDAKEQILGAFEREYLASLLRRCEGNVSRAARESGLHRKSIERLVKKYALDAKAMKER
ncbi:MAG: sigma 54-interacting transcriptional regulator [Deltaproteobacteria bacterium]